MGSLSAARWEYIKQLRPSPGRMVHCSDPPLVKVTYPAKQGREPETKMVRSDTGVTFFDFRNARKAAYREDARRSA